ncbi:MAG: hypothetical protein J7M15_00120, partial [Anaerolineae bacterium]|nr:hypothetical protein [Anaerolineae bacterium]
MALTRRRSLGAIGLYLVVVLAGLIGWLAGGPLHEQAGLAQGRLDTAAPPLVAGRSVGQSFLAEHPGLAWIEVCLVQYDNEADQPAEGTIKLTIEREDGLGSPVSVMHAISGLTHNQKLRFSFTPQPDSQGTRYRFTLTCSADAGLSVWYTQDEAYASGNLLFGGEPHEGDLCFSVGYRYGPVEVLRALARQARRWWPATAAVVLAWILPGWGILTLLRTGADDDLWERLGLAAALSASLWALAFLWARVFGLRLGPLAGGVLALAFTLIGIVWRARGVTGAIIYIHR